VPNVPFEPYALKGRTQHWVKLIPTQKCPGSDVVLGKIGLQALAEKKGVAVSAKEKRDQHDHTHRQEDQSSHLRSPAPERSHAIGKEYTVGCVSQREISPDVTTFAPVTSAEDS
jgi:hypothetical protein